MNIRKRVERLEGERGGSDDGPSGIFICDAETGEPWSALGKGGDGFTRETDESAEAFEARATAGAPDAMALAFKLEIFIKEDCSELIREIRTAILEAMLADTRKIGGLA
tara:strand:- start:219 stop:545 length:327 start_codon:yes stop_codon:yes gene_type:complete